MILEDLVGEHLLDAVDFSNSQAATLGGGYVDSQVIRFRLDGIVYQALENPDDGYRSSMRDILVADCPMENVFQGVRVAVTHRDRDGSDACDLLELIDCVTGKIVLTVGTDNTDDYYPSFVANFTPENMVINARSV